MELANMLGYFYDEVQKKFRKEPWRKYHNFDHVKHIADSCIVTFRKPSEKYERVLGELFALFHDVVYNPWEGGNEEASIVWMNEHAQPIFEPYYDDLVKLINYTKYDWESWSEIERKYWPYLMFDLQGLETTNPANIYKDEMNIFKEFQCREWNSGRQERIKILRSFERFFGINGPMAEDTGIYQRIEFLQNFQPNIGVYAGSFNPWHAGHQNVLEKAEQIFDKVIVAIGQNDSKASVDAQFVTNHVRNKLVYRQVVNYSGLLHTFLQGRGYDSTIIRGIRDSDDVNPEMKFAGYMRRLNNGKSPKIVHIMSDAEYAYISSSGERELAKYNK